MKTRSFSLILFLCFFSIPSFAHQNFLTLPFLKRNCQKFLLDSEFSREPRGRDGLVTDEVFMTTESLLEAYSRGIFPWEIDAETGLARWYSPSHRGILDFNRMKIPRKDMQFIRRALESGEYRVTDDQAFEEVMRGCARVKRTHDTWIAEPFLENYPKLAKLGFAHSVEVWKGDRLVGGFYGVFVNGQFNGESMFHEEPNVLKLALYHLIQGLAAKGHTWIDTQQVNGLIEKWGGHAISREEFLRKLDQSHQASLPYYVQ